MLRKFIFHPGLATDGCVLIDPTNETIIEGLYKKNIREGKEKLMLAVLENAVEYFQKYVLSRNTRGKQLFQEAEDWFLEKDGEALYSFESICETLGLHPDHIRKGLLVWKQARIKLGSVDGRRPVRPKLARSRIKHPSTRLSKTA